MVMSESEKFEIPVYDRFADEIDEFIETHNVIDVDAFILSFNEYYMKVTPEKFNDDPHKGHLFNWFSISEETYPLLKKEPEKNVVAVKTKQVEQNKKITKVIETAFKKEIKVLKDEISGKNNIKCLLVKCNNPKCNNFMRINYYELTHFNRLYCSDKCRIASFRNKSKPGQKITKVKKLCNSCDTIFKTIDNRTYCSHYCEYNNRKLTKLSYKSYIKQITEIYELYKVNLPDDTQDMSLDEFLDTIFIEKGIYKEKLQ